MAEIPVTVGVDGSDASLAAVRWGAAEAARRGVPLRLLHAHRSRGDSRQFFVGTSAEEERVVERMRAACQEATQRHPELAAAAEETPQAAVEALLEAAGTSALLVLGSRGAGRLSGFLTGSVALPVVAHATGPVVVVRDGTDDVSQVPPDSPVVVGLDVEHRIDPVAGFAFDEAESMHRPLVAVHVWTLQHLYAYPSALPDPRVGAGLEARAHRALESGLGPWCAEHPDVKTRRLVLDGRVAPRLLQAAEEACLVVVGRRLHKRRSPAAPLGSVTHAVLHHAAAPVAVVPHY
ncbi:universal stress protein [Streptomyces sp. TR06-5]|uniref:universal stress protein n=1 Tax=Streptomyces sp. TR06-5 TaxID=3385976 RepID=UPI0039A3E0D0